MGFLITLLLQNALLDDWSICLAEERYAYASGNSRDADNDDEYILVSDCFCEQDLLQHEGMDGERHAYLL